MRRVIQSFTQHARHHRIVSRIAAHWVGAPASEAGRDRLGRLRSIAPT
jgi:hypothetical protein